MLTQDEKYEKYVQASQEVLVDFDGTLCEFAYPDFGKPRRGARTFMQWLVDRGLRPIVWSSRLSSLHATAEEKTAIVASIHNWLLYNGMDYYAVDTGCVGKRLALAYVDDRGVAAGEGTTWAAARARINQIYRREQARWEEYDETDSTVGQDDIG